jgi:hypothetical protein
MGNATNGTVTTSAATWLAAGGPTQMGRFHCIGVNCAESNGVSQDGSWLHIQGSGLGYLTMVYTRMDNNEDGDLDPFVHQGNWLGSLNAAPNRTTDASGSGSGTDNANTGQAWINSTGSHGFKGFRRRGLSGETFNYFSVSMLYDFANAVYPQLINNGNPDQIGTAPNIQFVRDVLWLWLTPFTAQLATGRMRKGTLRWMQLVQGATGNMTFDGMTWVSLSSISPLTGIPFIVGPWDGATVPTY